MSRGVQYGISRYCPNRGYSRKLCTARRYHVAYVSIEARIVGSLRDGDSCDDGLEALLDERHPTVVDDLHCAFVHVDPDNSFARLGEHCCSGESDVAKCDDADSVEAWCVVHSFS